MSIIGEIYRRHLAPVLIRVWPSTANPAWRLAAARKAFGATLGVKIAPSRVAHKLAPAAMRQLKGAFLVEGLGALPMDPIDRLYTHQDMVEIAHHREDFRATRVYHWFRASIDAGRPVLARGVVVDSDDKIERYYRMYLSMLQSMETNGYDFSGDDEMCFGVTATGDFVLIRRGTHRLATAQILGLPAVSGVVTHVDVEFAGKCRRDFSDMTLAAAIARGIQDAAARP
jgi:hypothetical protein